MPPPFPQPRHTSLQVLVALLFFLLAALAWCSDWPILSGSPARTGWARSEHILTKENIHSLQLLYKFQTDNQARGLNSLTSPIVDGNLITYRGFKEMLVFSATSDHVYSVDADLNKLIWEQKFNTSPAAPASAVCPGGMTSPVVMPGSSSASLHFGSFRGRPPASRLAVPVPPPPPPVAHNRPMLIVPEFTPEVTPLTINALDHLEVFFTVSSDGNLHLLNAFNGEDLVTPLKFVPAGSKVTTLNLRDNTLYATTAGECGSTPDALYALNILSPDKRVACFTTNGTGFAGLAATAIGDDGTVFVQVAQGSSQFAGEYQDTVLALTPRDLQIRDFFTPPGKPSRKKHPVDPGITPMVFRFQGKELLLAASNNSGRIYLLDAAMLGGRDHRTPLAQTDRLVSRKKNDFVSGFRGTFSSWFDVDSETRWAYAPVWGPLDDAAPFPTQNGTAPSGSILAFKLTTQNNTPKMDPVWRSPDIGVPAPVVIANDMVLALSTGQPSAFTNKKGKLLDVPKLEAAASHAVIQAFDSATGKQLYSSGAAVSTFSYPGGLAVANGRLYFAGHDNHLYCFGLRNTQPQLTGQ